jgi:CspA family cold shock protein
MGRYGRAALPQERGRPFFRNDGDSEMREKGKIRSYLADRGFGFIQRCGAPPVFFHIKQVQNLEDETQLQPGVELEFEVEQHSKGLNAVDVVLV